MPPKHRRPPIPAGNIYRLTPPPRYVFWFWLALALLCFAASFSVAKPPLVPVWQYKVEFGSLLFLAVFLVWISFSAVSHRIEISGTFLRLYGGFFYRNLKAEDIDIAGARVVDLTREPDCRPVLWLGGPVLFGYRAGFWRLRRGGCAWVIVTDPRSVLWLPCKEGRPYLLSLQDGAGLLARLQKYASRPESGGEQ